MASRDKITKTSALFTKLTHLILDEAVFDSGFIVAFMSTKYPYHIGFCFFKRERNYIGAVRGVAHSNVEPLHLEVDACAELEKWVAFIQRHLYWVASQMGFPYGELMGDIDNKFWRFIGYVDNVADRWADNSITWRALWGRLIEVATPERLSYHEPKVVQLLIKGLRHCAADGQVVLDR